ncbi:hypothetical protein LENED_004167 [Lentinula edodes]|uniref:Uncharacterized protein n=1 Tax=Lentinula edodes TaxID=5353 RepID=A0A1Q3E5G3_LENED|nr:hypothetical protein LENED_004167 [Lentinula edodes]
MEESAPSPRFLKNDFIFEGNIQGRCYLNHIACQIITYAVLYALHNIAGMNEAFASFAPSASKNPKSRRVVEMSFHGLTANRNWRLACIRNSGSGTRTFSSIVYIYHMYHYRKPNIITYTSVQQS